MACRVGGDEFAVILPESSAEDAELLAGRIARAIGARPIGAAGNLRLSAGAAELRSGDRPNDLFERADEALYQAKEQGKAQHGARREPRASPAGRHRLTCERGLRYCASTALTVVGIAVAVAAVLIALLFREEIGTRLETVTVTLPPPAPAEAPTPVPDRPAPKVEAPPDSRTAPAEEAIAAELIRQLRTGQLDEARATFDRLHSDDDDPEARGAQRDHLRVLAVAARRRRARARRARFAPQGPRRRRARRAPDRGGARRDGPLRPRRPPLRAGDRRQQAPRRPRGRGPRAREEPDRPRPPERRGLAALPLGRTRAATTNSAGSSSRSSRGSTAKARNGSTGRAALEVALETEPNNAARQFDAAFAYSQAGREDLALMHYKAALEADSDHRPAINNLGVAYERLGLRMKAVTEYKRAADLGESLGKANLGLSFLNAGFRAEGEEILYDATAGSERARERGPPHRVDQDQGRPGEVRSKRLPSIPRASYATSFAVSATRSPTRGHGRSAAAGRTVHRGTWCAPTSSPGS